MNNKLSSKIEMLLAMIIFGTGGIISRFVPFSSGLICFVRGLLGSAVLALAMLLTGRSFSRGIKGRFLLLLSGAAIGINWVLLFSAYRYTTVAISTLCYYMAPMFVLLFSALFLKEKLGLRRWLCLGLSLLGMAFVSGVLPGGLEKGSSTVGVLLALGAAFFYASVVLLNKKSPEGVPGLEKTLIQMVGATLIIGPYLLFTEDFSALAGQLSLRNGLILLWMGLVNTGLAYLLYFRGMSKLKASSVAFLSYVDPLTAVLLSAFLLKEPLSLWGWIGALLVLGGAVLSEL